MAYPDKPLRLGTRASPLAMAQAHKVRDALCAAHGWSHDTIEIKPVIASGDKILDRALAEVGGKALWTKELDVSLLSGEIDFAVHSMKDVETVRPAAFMIAAMLERGDVRDRLIGVESPDALPFGARVGTSAPRRTAQLLRLRPDLKITLFRGNVATRLAKLNAGEADATLLAAAGLDRLGMFDTGTAVPVDVMLPAPSQGAIGIETLANNVSVNAWISEVDHAATYHCVSAERAVLAALSGDCRSPIAALAIIDGASINLRAEILSPDGRLHVTGEAHCAAGDLDAAYALGKALLDRAPPALRAHFG
ncbi:MAG: hydroxymethylbilane synthase [Chakrabartia sp.]